MVRSRWERLTSKNYRELGMVRQVTLFPAFLKSKSYVLLIENKPIVIIQFLPLAKGSIEVTMHPGLFFRQYKKTAVAKLKSSLDEYFVTEGLNRMQANTMDLPVLWRFMEFLGFEFEGRMTKFNAGNDHILWAYTRAK